MTDHPADADNAADDEDEEGDGNAGKERKEDAGEAAPQCSAKGCRAPAMWAVRWRNPKIHEPGRRKIWLACDAHRAHLSGFLDRRGFPHDVVPLDDID